MTERLLGAVTAFRWARGSCLHQYGNNHERCNFPHDEQQYAITEEINGQVSVIIAREQKGDNPVVLTKRTRAMAWPIRLGRVATCILLAISG
jgi:hypothetical protein